MPEPIDDPSRALDEVQPIDSGALMREVREEVERRRAEGKYPPALDDVPPFEDLGLEDDLVASVHRLESLSRIPGITPSSTRSPSSVNPHATRTPSLGPSGRTDRKTASTNSAARWTS